MLKRYFLTFFWLLLLLIGLLLSLVPLLVIRGKLDEPTSLTLLCLWAVLAPLSFLFAWGLLISKVWFFPGTGEPATLEQVQEQLLGLNGLPCPIQVTCKRKKLSLTWRSQELQWCELLSDRGITRLYELHCRFDAATRTVFLADRMRTADFLICPERVKIGFCRIPFPFLGVRLKRLGTIAQYATMQPQAYTFHPREIKSPVMGTILASGWNVRFSLL